jgi:hypothetical protein
MELLLLVGLDSVCEREMVDVDDDDSLALNPLDAPDDLAVLDTPGNPDGAKDDTDVDERGTLVDT